MLLPAGLGRYCCCLSAAKHRVGATICSLCFEVGSRQAVSETRERKGEGATSWDLEGPNPIYYFTTRPPLFSKEEKDRYVFPSTFSWLSVSSGGF